MNTITRALALCLALAVVSGCSGPSEVAPADTVFFGRHILTMDKAHEHAKSVAVSGGKIVFVGGRREGKRYVGPDTEVIRLGKRALLPGFFDAHGHFAHSARLLEFANLSSPPVGTVSDIPTLISSLKEYAKQSGDANDWLVGFGYDDTLMTEHRHPTRDDLDAVSKERPIMLIHVSFHFVALNSAGLRKLRINAGTPDPDGGHIRRWPGGTVPNGVLDETASHPALFQLRNMSPEKYEALLRKTADDYASYGITTAQDGAASARDLQFIRSVAAQERLPIDVNFYETVFSQSKFNEIVVDSEYRDGLRLAGVKLLLDGSPQGRTAWMTKPYEVTEYHKETDYRAYNTIDKGFYKRSVAELLRLGTPFIAHANGDAAIDLMLDGLDEGLKRHPNDDHRSVVIHAQLMREDQVARAKQLNAIASFFSAHPFFWGDWHVKIFGDRAINISPTGWAVEAGLKFTLHNDAPVIPPDMMRLVWVTANRKTRSGLTLGPDQRLDVMRALRAVTIDAAYQAFEEHIKGSISVGKQADLVILEQSPLKVDKEQLADIKVVRTIARGKTIFTAPN